MDPMPQSRQARGSGLQARQAKYFRGRDGGMDLEKILEMEALKEAGLVKSIGVSNFGVSELETLIQSAKIKPAANQILLHPYVYAQQKPIIEFGAKHGIVTEAYSSLIPITQQPGGPLDGPLNEIAKRWGATPDQILFAWVKSKGAIVVTTSSKKYRLEGYLSAGNIELSEEDITALEKAGKKGLQQLTAKVFLGRLALVALGGAAGLYYCSLVGIEIL